MSDIPAAPPSRRCPYCGETVNPDAVLCRYCSNSLPRDLVRVEQRGARHVLGVDTVESFGVWEQSTGNRRGTYPRTDDGWKRAWSDFQKADGASGSSGKRRPFTWVIVAINVLFLIWVIVGVGAASDPTDCGGLSQESCNAAAAAGTAIGVGIVVVLWAFVDVILGIVWLVTRKPPRG